MFRGALVLLTASLGASAAGEEFAPGREVEFEFGGLVNPLVIYLPENYSPDRRWPVVFHYHGTAGKPDVGIPRAYTGGRDFVLVGMEYATLGNEAAARERDYLEIELELLRSLRAELGRRISIDPRRSIVGGFSKGGWFASEFADSHSADFAAAYVLGAGKVMPDRRPIRPIKGGMPLYIGIGQRDINYIFSVQAIGHFRRQGAQVTYDEYLGAGHAMPRRMSDHFLQWWSVLARQGDRLKLSPLSADWAVEARRHFEGIGDPMDRYLYLRRLRGAPYYPLIEESLRERFEEPFTALSADPELRAELAAQREYLAILGSELGASGMEHLLKTVRRYDALHRRAPELHYGRRAGMEMARLLEQVRDLDRWRFPSAEARRAVEAKLAAEPLPEVEVEELLKEFVRLRGVLRP